MPSPPERFCGPSCTHFRSNGLGAGYDGECRIHPPIPVKHHGKIMPVYPPRAVGLPACDDWQTSTPNP